jgi:hypothetical protein
MSLHWNKGLAEALYVDTEGMVAQQSEKSSTFPLGVVNVYSPFSRGPKYRKDGCTALMWLTVKFHGSTTAGLSRAASTVPSLDNAAVTLVNKAAEEFRRVRP